jgi:hypothetical protein
MWEAQYTQSVSVTVLLKRGTVFRDMSTRAAQRQQNISHVTAFRPPYCAASPKPHTQTSAPTNGPGSSSRSHRAATARPRCTVSMQAPDPSSRIENTENSSPSLSASPIRSAPGLSPCVDQKRTGIIFSHSLRFGSRNSAKLWTIRRLGIAQVAYPIGR